MHRENYINVLREEIVETVSNHLTPAAVKYGYSEMPLETNIKWRPMVLLIGNYSSGKSSLINEFLGADIQDTGQAPTDDSFTVITYDETIAEDTKIKVTEERDGKVLLNDPEYPFSTLRKQGQRFAAHFRLKKSNSPFLKDLAIIDTPGMLDSITERRIAATTIRRSSETWPRRPAWSSSSSTPTRPERSARPTRASGTPCRPLPSRTASSLSSTASTSAARSAISSGSTGRSAGTCPRLPGARTSP